jgi:hypothetical protein
MLVIVSSYCIGTRKFQAERGYIFHASSMNDLVELMVTKNLMYKMLSFVYSDV